MMEQPSIAYFVYEYLSNKFLESAKRTVMENNGYLKVNIQRKMIVLLYENPVTITEKCKIFVNSFLNFIGKTRKMGFYFQIIKRFGK